VKKPEAKKPEVKEPEAKVERVITLRPADGWVTVTYEGEGVFVHRRAGIFAKGTTTRLRAELADQLRGTRGFRLAGSLELGHTGSCRSCDSSLDFKPFPGGNRRAG
jgi:hypothetical protein